MQLCDNCQALEMLEREEHREACHSESCREKPLEKVLRWSDDLAAHRRKRYSGVSEVITSFDLDSHTLAHAESRHDGSSARR